MAGEDSYNKLKEYSLILIDFRTLAKAYKYLLNFSVKYIIMVLINILISDKMRLAYGNLVSELSYHS